MPLADLFKPLISPKCIVFDASYPANRNVGNGMDILSLVEAEQFCLSQRWVQLNFINDRFDAAIAEQVSQQLQVEVRDADRFCQALIH